MRALKIFGPHTTIRLLRLGKALGTIGANLVMLTKPSQRVGVGKACFMSNRLPIAVPGHNHVFGLVTRQLGQKLVQPARP